MKSCSCATQQVANRNSQQLGNKSLLVHHVGHVWHIQAAKLWTVLEHNVSNLRYQHAFSQSGFQIHKKPGGEGTSAQRENKQAPLWMYEILQASLFTGCHDAVDVGKQAVVLHLRQGLFQDRGGIEMIDSYSEAP